MEESSNQNGTPSSSSESSANTDGPINFTPKTDREIKSQEKKRRTEKIIGALGDGLMSLSNLYFTTKGAPSVLGDQSINSKSNRRKPTFLTTAIQERHRAEDKEYELRYNSWKNEIEKIRKAQLAQQKDDERNRRVQLADNFGIKVSNWEQEDFVNQLFDAIIDWNTDEGLASIIDNLRYEYQPIWEWLGTGWTYEHGHDKKIDLFKGKSGTYLKRDLIETLFGEESWTTPENRQKLMENVIDFENNWIPLK